jgi:dihydrofolate reductase
MDAAYEAWWYIRKFPRCRSVCRLCRVVTGVTNPKDVLGKVVVNRSMSLDGFIAGPDDAMDWVMEYMKEDRFPEVMAATGAMLIGRGTYEAAKRMSEEDTGYDGGPVFVLTHRPPDEPEPGVTFLTCDLAEAVATAHAVAAGRNLEILGADLASQCLQRGLVDEVLVYVLPVLLGDGVRFSTLGLGRIDLEPMGATQSGPVTMLRFSVPK